MSTVDAPQSTKSSSSGFGHYPALDGVRGIAVAGVLVFHGGFEIATGGFLGVSTFFTLSGFLITSLLLAERASTGTIALGAFWKRRFKRLLPAAVTCIGLIAVFWSWLDLQSEADFSPVDVVGRIPGDLLAALFYVYNWRAAFPPEGAGYNALFEEVVEPSPAAHFWSLSIEEQFYVFFPLLAALILAYLAWSKRVFAATLVGLLALSVLSVTWLDGFDRIYNGTDVRMAEILVGALLAVAFSYARGRDFIMTHPIVAWTGVAALALTVFLWYETTLRSGWLLEGGLFGYAMLSALVIMAATQATGPVSFVLSWSPLVWLGAVSYGLYLYHWPIFRWIDHDSTGLDPIPLFVARIAVTLAVAWLSYHYLEQPIRRGIKPGAGVSSIAIPIGVTAAIVIAMTVAYSEIGRDDVDLDVAFDGDEDIALLTDVSTTTTDADEESPLTTLPESAEPTGGSQAGLAPATTTSAAPLVLEDRPPVVALIGDSIGINLREALSRRAEALELPPLTSPEIAHAGCDNTYGEGEINRVDLILPSCRDSYAPIEEAFDRDQPDAVVIVGSTVDLMEHREAPDAPWLALTDEMRRGDLRAKLGELQATAVDRGMSVVWVTVPCIADFKAEPLGIEPEHVPLMNEVIKDVAADGPPTVTVFDLYAEVCPGGEFVRELAGDPQAREDGLHFSPGVADILAKELGEVIDSVAPVAQSA